MASRSCRLPRARVAPRLLAAAGAMGVAAEATGVVVEAMEAAVAATGGPPKLQEGAEVVAAAPRASHVARLVRLFATNAVARSLKPRA